MVKQQSVEEKRRWVRAERILCIEFRLIKSKRRIADKSWGLSMTKDMSAGGIAFYTDREFSLGDTLELRVTMSGILNILSGLAEIVRIERKKTGAFYLVAVKMLEKDLKTKREKSLQSFRRTKTTSQKRI